jgi:cytochrome c-type biogenesis protein CcmH
MITFWIAAVMVTALAVGLMTFLAARPVPVAADPSRTVYRRQLTEIDDLAERGLLGEDERQSAHAEAARRLLGETDAAPETTTPPGARAFVWGMALLTAVFAIVVYLLIGSPGAHDQPFAKRLAAWKALPIESLDARQIVALLEDVKKKEGNDPAFLSALADMQMRTGNVIVAARNLQRSVDLDGNVAETWSKLGQAQMDLAEGKMTPQARASFEKALSLNPKLPAPRFYLANDDIEKGRKEQGLAAMRAMLPELEPEVRSQVAERIAEVERGPAAPSDVATSPAVMAMVQGLAERLKTDPNDPAGWARLVHAYAVQKDTAKLNAALGDARRYFKDRPADLAGIETAANAAAPPQ